MTRDSFQDVSECGEILVIRSLTFTCELARAHDGAHRCRADDEGTEVEWVVVWPAKVDQEANVEKDSAHQFKAGSGSLGAGRPASGDMPYDRPRE